MGTRENRLGEAVLTSTYNLCFERKYETFHFFFFFVVKWSVYLNRRVFVISYMNHYRQEINQDKAYIEAKPRTQQKQRAEIPGGPWGVKHHWNTLVEGSGVYMGTWPLKKRTHSYTKSSV